MGFSKDFLGFHMQTSLLNCSINTRPCSSSNGESIPLIFLVWIAPSYFLHNLPSLHESLLCWRLFSEFPNRGRAEKKLISYLKKFLEFIKKTFVWNKTTKLAFHLSVSLNSSEAKSSAIILTISQLSSSHSWVQGIVFNTTAAMIS